MDLTTATPSEIDTRLAELERQDAKLTYDIQSAWSDLRAALGHRQVRVLNRDGRAEYVYLISSHDAEHEAVAPDASTNTREAYQALHALRKQVLVNRAERTKIKVEFNRRGGWTRAWAVPNGHVHQSTACSTCFPTTRFGWLSQVSGMNEAEIVAQAGERACTRCYPSAPVNPKPCQLWTIEEQAERASAQQVAAVKAEKAAAKAAKAITNPDGSPLRGKWGVIATERTAEIEAVNEIHNFLAFDYEINQAYLDTLFAALAHKRGQTVEEVTAVIQAKATKKAAKTMGPSIESWNRP
jgi:hypothetical protein